MRDRIKQFWTGLSWPKIIGETLIVVIGVFLGTQASNWNTARAERADVTRMLRNLRPETRNLIQTFASFRAYYRVTRRYADVAFAGWRDDAGVSDRDFVIAAYQASQIYQNGVSNQTWSQIVGGDRLRLIDDRGIREDLSAMMTSDDSALARELFTDYRRHVREVIPEDVQDAIRRDCGDRTGGNLQLLTLPATCTLALPDARLRIAAEALRDRPDLVGELRWHLAATTSYSDNVRTSDAVARRLLGRIERI